MKAAMVVTWTEPIPGRETKALEYGVDVTTYWTNQAKAGKCSTPETYFSERGKGMWIVVGERDDLLAIHDTDESRDLIMRGQFFLNEFCVDFFTVGDASDAVLARYASLAGALA